MNFDCPLPPSCIFDSKLVPGNYTSMNSVQPALLEHILERISVGVVILDCISLRILYVNTYLQTLLPSSLQAQSLIGHSLKDILPDEEFKIIEPILQEVCSTDREATFSDVPYEGDSWKNEAARTGIYRSNILKELYQSKHLKNKMLVIFKILRINYSLPFKM